MTDVAQRAGVSKTTVSFVLNDKQSAQTISGATRQRVLDAAQSLGYRRNALAHAAITGKNRVLGFLVDRAESVSASLILNGALDEAKAQGYFIKVLRSNRDGVDRAVVEDCLEQRLAGVIGLYLNSETLRYLQDEAKTQNVPVATADSYGGELADVRVETDDHQAMGLAVRHLAQLGHRRIALMSATGARREDGYQPAFDFAAPREAAFLAAMNDCGLDVPDGFVVDSHFDVNRVSVLLEELRRHPAGAPTAFIGVTDGEAMRVVNAAFLAGRNVPNDLSVVGYGGLPMGDFCLAPLTSVKQPFHEIGRVAVRLLLQRLAQNGGAPKQTRQELLPAELLVRASTAPPR